MTDLPADRPLIDIWIEFEERWESLREQADTYITALTGGKSHDR